MAEQTKDIEEMLNYLNLPLMAAKVNELQRAPEGVSLTPVQYLREIIEPQVLDTKNNRFLLHLRLSSLVERSADIANLKTGNGRIYNDNVVRQLLTFEFVENKKNVNVFGVTDAGKSYFLSAFCMEACRREIRCKFIDYAEFMDDMQNLYRDNYTSYKRKLKYYSKVQLLMIDDFAINKYSEDAINILYHLIKSRTDNGVSTMISCQYSPEEWGKHLSFDEDCYGKLDEIRRRLINDGYYVLIEKSK